LEVFKFKDGGSNNTYWENQEYVALLDRSVQTIDPIQRRDLLAQSEKMLIDEMPILPIFHFTMLYLNPSYVKDVVLTSMGRIDFKWASIEEEIK
jgi:oligopeptide transport system substrate-binding protein